MKKFKTLEKLIEEAKKEPDQEILVEWLKALRKEVKTEKKWKKILENIETIEKIMSERQGMWSIRPPDIFGPAFKFEKPGIPFTFIPVPAGGFLKIYLEKWADTRSESIINESKLDEKIVGELLLEESIIITDVDDARFILSNFSPGIHKRRWFYQIAGVPSEILEEDYALVSYTIECFRSKLVSNKILVTKLSEKWILDNDDLQINIPHSIKLLLYPERVNFHFSPDKGQLQATPAKNVDGMLAITDEPRGNSFHYLIKLSEQESNKIERIPSAVFDSISLLEKVELLDIFYATDVHLKIPNVGILHHIYWYAEKTSRSPNNNPANNFSLNNTKINTLKPFLIGLPMNAQGIRFEVSNDYIRNTLDDLDELLEKDKALPWDLKFSKMIVQMNGKLYSKTENPYTTSTLASLIAAMESWARYYGKTLGEFIEEKDSWKDMDRVLVPEYMRLWHMTTRENLFGALQVLKSNHRYFEKIIKAYEIETFHEEELRNFTSFVLMHTLKHAVIAGCELIGTVGKGMIEGHLQMPGPTTDSYAITLFDTLEGGAGVSELIFNKLKSNPNLLEEQVRRVTQCSTSIHERIIRHILENMNIKEHTRIRQILRGSIKQPDKIINSISRDLLEILGDTKVDLSKLAKIFTVDEEQIQFYKFVAEKISELQELIHRTPSLPDILVYLYFFKQSAPTNARQAWLRFERSKERGDLSILATKIVDVMNTCVHACPDCLLLRNCQYTIFPQDISILQLDRRLIEK